MRYRTLNDCLSKREDNFNLIRLLAAFLVIYGHASAVTGRGPVDIFLSAIGFKFIGGVAVDIFFVISGFFISASANSGLGWGHYLYSRILRIYPALFVCIALTVFVIGPFLTTDHNYWSDATFRYLVFNSAAIHTEYFLPGVFQSLHDKAINGSLWSLPLEVRLYFAVFLVGLFGTFKKIWIFNFFALALVLAGFFLPEYIANLLPHPSHLSVAAMFLLGSLCYVNRVFIVIHINWFILFLIVAAVTHSTRYFYLGYALTLTYGVFYVAYAKKIPWSKKIGDYSYGVYLYGWLAQQMLLTIYPDMSNGANAIFAFGISLAAALASWYFIEKPSLSFKNRLMTSPSILK